MFPHFRGWGGSARCGKNPHFLFFFLKASLITIFFVDEPCRPELNHRINSTNEDDHDRFNSIEEEVSKDKTNFNFKNSFFHDEFKVSEI